MNYPKMFRLRQRFSGPKIDDVLLRPKMKKATPCGSAPTSTDRVWPTRASVLTAWLGAAPSDPWSADFLEEPRDWGDHDLTHAITLAQARGHPLVPDPLVRESARPVRVRIAEHPSGR